MLCQSFWHGVNALSGRIGTHRVVPSWNNIIRRIVPSWNHTTVPSWERYYPYGDMLPLECERFTRCWGAIFADGVVTTTFSSLLSTSKQAAGNEIVFCEKLGAEDEVYGLQQAELVSVLEGAYLCLMALTLDSNVGSYSFHSFSKIPHSFIISCCVRPVLTYPRSTLTFRDLNCFCFKHSGDVAFLSWLRVPLTHSFVFFRIFSLCFFA